MLYAILSGILLWLIWEYPFLLLLIPVIYLVDRIRHKKNKKHLSRLLENRRNYSICEFARHFEYRKIDTFVIRAVYEQLQNHMQTETFPILPTDDIFADLKIDEEDFEYDIVAEIAQRAGRSLDNVKHNPYYGKASIVENLVYFFNEQPRAT